MKLSATQERFILHWGEMGTRWGINRSVAQIHGLLYISESPLHAEEITETLALARSNVSTSLRELQGWGIVRVVHVLGDRRDHFESMQDVWEMFQVILSERWRREINPTLEMLRQTTASLATSKKGSDIHTREKLGDLLSLLESLGSCYQQIRRLPKAAFTKLVKMGDKVTRLLGLDTL